MDGKQPLSVVLKAIRKKLKWTQESLAQSAGYSRSEIASIESGSRPSLNALQRIIQAVPENYRPAIQNTSEARSILQGAAETAETQHDDSEDMVLKFMSVRRSNVDLSGDWNAMWLTTAEKKVNRNREVVHVRKRWNGSWEFRNAEVSAENPQGGYLWVARVELFDNRHILGYYCAVDANVSAKGTLCLELQTNGREIVGVWDGMNFDMPWASGAVAMCRATAKQPDPEVALDRFLQERPKMPY